MKRVGRSFTPTLQMKNKFDKSRQQVYRERFQLPGYQPPKKGEPVSIGDVIKNVVKYLEDNNRGWYLELEKEWPDLVGTVIARHARPGRVDKQTLVIFVDSAVWLNELVRYERLKMMEKLKSRFGESRIKTIRLLADPDRVKKRPRS